MKKLAMVIGVVAGVLVQTGLPSAQAEDPNLVIMRRLFSKLTNAITVGANGNINSNGAIPGQSFFIVMMPGIFVDPTLKMDTIAGREALADLGNRLPLVNWLYQESARSASELYERILDDTEQIYTIPSPNEVAELAKHRSFLYSSPGVPSAAYSKYLELQQTYYNAFSECELNRGQNPNCTQPLVVKKNLALKQWQTLGQKNVVETAIEREYQLTRTAQNWWSDLRQRFTAARETGANGDFHRVSSFPSYEQWFANDGWTKITITEATLNQTIESNRTSFGGAGGVNFGLFSVGASYNRTTLSELFDSKVTNFSIEMEVKRVGLYRPWLSRAIFDSRQWRFKQDKELVISDGNGTQSTAPQGVMPLLPTGLLLARNAVIKGIDADEFRKHDESHTSTGGSFGWGPFAISGHYNEDTSKTFLDNKNAGNSITIVQPQVIGWFTEVLPKTPNPVANGNWSDKPTQ